VLTFFRRCPLASIALKSQHPVSKKHQSRISISQWLLPLLEKCSSRLPAATIGLQTVRPDLLQHVTGSGGASQYFSNGVVCQRFNGAPSGPAPAIPDCASTPNAAFAFPCTTSSTPTSGNNYPIIAGSCHPGSLGRDAISGPGFLNTDFSVTKNTKITERFNLQFRSEMFDIFNHPNLGNPVLAFTNLAFGHITSTRFPQGDFGSSRQVQFALKLIF